MKTKASQWGQEGGLEGSAAAQDGRQYTEVLCSQRFDLTVLADAVLQNDQLQYPDEVVAKMIERFELHPHRFVLKQNYQDPLQQIVTCFILMAESIDRLALAPALRRRLIQRVEHLVLHYHQSSQNSA